MDQEEKKQFSRILGKRKDSTPVSETGIKTIPAVEKKFPVETRIPKGIFRYNSHEEANADMDKWIAETLAYNSKHLSVAKK
jgi:hypothetical protein